MILTLQNAFKKQIFLEEANFFSQLNNVLDPTAFNVDDFLTRDTVLLPFSLMGLFDTKKMLLTVESPER
jgi:hypothetical protein